MKYTKKELKEKKKKERIGTALIIGGFLAIIGGIAFYAFTM